MCMNIWRFGLWLRELLARFGVVTQAEVSDHFRRFGVVIQEEVDSGIVAFFFSSVVSGGSGVWSFRVSVHSCVWAHDMC